MNLILQRLHNQHLSGMPFATPEEVVGWFGAVQAQDFLGSLWAIGMRAKNATEASVEQAIAERKIIRTWPMRSTLHFVSPEDVRWMLKLLTPRVIARSQARYRQLELDDTVFTRSSRLFEKALRDGKQLARSALYEVLNAAGVSTSESRGLHILARLAQDGVICFGPRSGKQQTFVLLDEWVAPAMQIERETALAKLAERYFNSHGPATLHDFVWWSGLTVGEARTGLELVKTRLVEDRVNGKSYWAPLDAQSQKQSAIAHLLPPYDEYTIGYKDRSSLIDPAHAKLLDPVRSIFSSTILSNGRIMGGWKRTFEKEAVVVAHKLFARLKPADERALGGALRQYGRFLDLPIVVKTNGESRR